LLAGTECTYGGLFFDSSLNYNENFYAMKTPVAFFMGDTPEHDKLCCLWKPKNSCRMSDINTNDFDNSKKNYSNIKENV